ncbi:transposase [Bradyrhizobium sp. B120]|uniref:transposase n=1 Tax=Bradyrhizobium sp. B120 TaxID=3410088 RepID=UPI003B98279D
MVRLLARVIGVGLETADMLVQEVLSRNLRDRRAVARYVGLTGSPDESGRRRQEEGLAEAGNARVRRGLIQLAWRFLRFQRNSALAQWYQARTGGPKGARKTTMIVALARKLLIALRGWQHRRDPGGRRAMADDLNTRHGRRAAGRLSRRGHA